MKQYIQQILDDIEELSQIADAVDVQREADAAERNTLLSRIRELEAVEREEGEKWREFAAEIAPPGTPLAASGMISFGKLKEVVEAAIAVPARERDGARLALQAAQRELTRLRTLVREFQAASKEFYQGDVRKGLTDLSVAKVNLRDYPLDEPAPKKENKE